MRYRHELKYPITTAERFMELSRIGALAEPDTHSQNGIYHIRSIYFDNYGDRHWRDTLDGVDDRIKYRIRAYDCDSSFIRLERKEKKHGMTAKVSCRIDEEQCRKLMKGMWPDQVRPDQLLLQELAVKMQTERLMPKVIVAYDRIPFVYRAEDANVRVTFDHNILSIPDVDAFFDRGCMGRSILSAGTELMEVKFDAFLPDEMKHLLQLENRHISSFSKYDLCRRMSI